MLPSYNRLNLTRKEKHGFRVQDKDFILVQTKKTGIFKAAVVVSKKIAKLAVDRNRIRRITTSALRLIEKPAGEWVIIVKENIKAKKSTNIKTQLKDLFNKFK